MRAIVLGLTSVILLQPAIQNYTTLVYTTKFSVWNSFFELSLYTFRKYLLGSSSSDNLCSNLPALLIISSIYLHQQVLSPYPCRQIGQFFVVANIHRNIEQSLVQRCQWKHLFSASSKTVLPLIFKLFQMNAVSACCFQFSFNVDVKRFYNPDKFVKQFGEFVFQNSCYLRHFG